MAAKSATAGPGEAGGAQPKTETACDPDPSTVAPAAGRAAWARRYAELGLGVFPLAHGDKAPLIAKKDGGNGFHDATTDPERIAGWWRRWPLANIGIVPPQGCFVLDIDDLEALQGLRALDCALPTTVTQRTPRPGLHLLYRMPAGLHARTIPKCSSLDVFGVEGLETKCHGAGYIVAAPSTTYGDGYEWETPPLPRNITEAPAWLVDLVRVRERDDTAPAPVVEAEIPEGRRNGTLTSLAGTMRRRGFEEQAILAALVETNRSRCAPPLPHAEVAAIAHSVARYEPPATHATDGQGSEANTDPETLGAFAVPIGEFVADAREAPEPLLGTPDDCLIPARGLAMLIARGGKGKTTLAIDLALHLAAGIEWLGFVVPRPLAVLFVENEGPREPFRRKLERRLATWPHEIRGALYVYDDTWGAARLDAEAFVERLNDFCDEHAIDLVIGDPLDSLGMEGEGSPSETRAMIDAMKGAGLFSQRAWICPHHSRKERAEDIVDAASGAWGGRPDTMLVLEKRPENRAQLYFAKTRWGGRARQPYILAFDSETETFGFLAEGSEERDLAGEIQELLSTRQWLTAKEISAQTTGIGARLDGVIATLRSAPDLFVSCTGDAARALGRRSNATLWNTAEGVPEAREPLGTQGPGRGVADANGNGFPPIGEPVTVTVTPPTPQGVPEAREHLAPEHSPRADGSADAAGAVAPTARGAERMREPGED